MKLLMKLFLLCLIVSSCNEESKKIESSESYSINGKAPGVINGVRVYLKRIDERGRFAERDTAIVMNETFTFNGNVTSPERLTIHVNSVTGSVPLILENDNIDITIDKDNIINSKISGTKSNDALSTYFTESSKYRNEGVRLNSAYRKALSENDTVTLNKLALELQQANDVQIQFPLDFIKKNNDNYFSLILLEELFQNKNYALEDLSDLYNGFDKDLMQSELGKKVDSKLNQLKEENKRLAALDVGKLAPEFSGPNPEGKVLSLNAIKGKATIVDFWAAWCGPCRRENPNVVNVYNKYHDKGLEIIGVSLDGSGRQPDPKAAWIQAIKDDKLTWNHVSNLKYFQDPIALIYNINSIPATYILDAEGKIVAKNLRGQDLENKIAEMLK